MPNGDFSPEQVLGTIALLADTIPSHDSSKIDYGEDSARNALHTSAEDERSGEGEQPEARATQSAEPDGSESAAKAQAIRPPVPPNEQVRQFPVKPGSEEAFYLLATYCFDLQRKMEYLYRAARVFGLRGDPAFARDLLNDERRINRAGLTWKQRAQQAEARMLELQREIGREHLELLKRVAAGGGQQKSEEPPRDAAS